MFGPFDTEYERTTMTQRTGDGPRWRDPGKWKEEHPAPKWDLQMTPEEKAARHDWEIERAKALKAFFIDELAKIKANDEVPMPQAAPVAPAQEVVPAGSYVLA